jgi:hypothetical protein
MMVGGSSVDLSHKELLNGKNADYLLPEFNCIGELKRIHKNLDATINAKRKQMVESWIRRGLIPKPQHPRFSLDMTKTPLECQYAIRSMLAKFLEDNQLKKANRQIKALKERLSRPSAIGILFLMLEATEAYRPEVLGWLLHHLLKEKYSSIGSVIVLNHGVSARLSVEHCTDPHLKNVLNHYTGGNDVSLFLHFAVDGRPNAPPELIAKLADAWRTVIGLEGAPMLRIASPETGEQLAILKGLSLGPH